MIWIKEGNLLESRASILCHQVNCQNRMGSGVAKSIASRWPIVKKSYHEFCSGKDPSSLLGCVQVIYCENGRYVANIFGQLHYGYDGKQYTDYAALEHAFQILSRMTTGSVAFPYGFGCGLGGGDWQIVYALIKKYFSDREVIICKLPEVQNGHTNDQGTDPKPII